MKKFIYIAVLSILVSFAVTSCTEENVKPTIEEKKADASSGSPDKLKD
jgi:hypothetical protein